jgi:arylsulfatase A-like enzyme
MDREEVFQRAVRALLNFLVLGFLRDQVAGAQAQPPRPNILLILAEVLREAGYRTYMVGKWHLHNQQDVKPTDRGFDEFYGMLGGYNSCWAEKPFYTRWPADRIPRPYTSAVGDRPGTFYSTDAFADYALDFLRDARKAWAQRCHVDTTLSPLAKP